MGNDPIGQRTVQPYANAELTPVKDIVEEETLHDIIERARIAHQQYQPEVESQNRQGNLDAASPCETPGQPGHYDFDLAEFPVFRLYKPQLSKHEITEPLAYTDTIKGKDGQDVIRQWKAYPGRYGYGGASTQALLYELFQLYHEQGYRGTQIQFGTLTTLFHRLHPGRRPSKSDLDRLRRDLRILCGYRFEAKNAFWDSRRQAYVDIDEWSLFTGVLYFKERQQHFQEQRACGFIEVHPILCEIVKSRGFFALGFQSDLFHTLKPLEQRLAVYLARKFLYQHQHQRYIDDLAQALPIEAHRPDNVRTILKKAANGLLEKHLPILHAFHCEKSPRHGRWVAVFIRKPPLQQGRPTSQRAMAELEPGVAFLVRDIIEATGNGNDWPWWKRCAEVLGETLVYHGLGQLKETCRIHHVRNRGAMLTTIFKDIARAHSLSLGKEE